MIVSFDTGTGQVLQWADDPVSDPSAYVREGVGVLVSDIVPDNHYVLGGDLVAFPPRPTPYHDWEWVDREWVPNLQRAREVVQFRWSQWRDRELKAGYVQDGLRYHSDETFMNELSLILKAYERGHFAENSLRTIRLMDNTNMRMGWAAIENLLLQIGLRRESIYEQSWYWKDALESMTTVEAIMAAAPDA